jgi:hypothetical protein
MTVIQNALANLVEIEKQVERALAANAQPKANKLNSVISDDIDGLLTVLSQLKNQPSGDFS